MRFDALLNNPGLKLALSPLLLPASALYAAGLLCDRRRSGARKSVLAAPTISVGNLTVGGTGKTPVLLRLASDLRAIGRRPAVLTRGYAGLCRKARTGIVRSAAEAAGFSDEVRLMAETLPGVPIAAGPRRAEVSAPLFTTGECNVAVMDDGFQHWPLARDLDVVCVDATDPWGSGFLLPMGRLREPRSALGRAGVVLVTRCERVPAERAAEIASTARRLAPAAAVLQTRFELRLVSPDGRSAVPPERALAVSAIGNPGAFEANLASLGVVPVSCRYGDHHAYGPRDLEAILERARAENMPVVTTGKDWVKLRELVTSQKSSFLIAAQTLSFGPGDEALWNGRIAAALKVR